MKLAALVFALLAACGSSSPTTKHGLPTMHLGANIDPAKTLETTNSEVTFDVSGHKVGGTVVTPKAAGPWPAVVILAGSGPTDRDWNSPLIPTHNGSGKLLAEELAKHGAVVLRFDKAGSGSNPGPKDVNGWTLDMYRDEAVAAIDLVRARPDVRQDAVFIAGHSEGGLHATRTALAAGPKLNGVIYLSSAARTMADTVLTQLDNQLHNPITGLTKIQADAESASMRVAMADFVAGKTVDPTKASTLPPLQAMVTSLNAQPAQQLVRTLMGYDNAKEAPQLTVPCLVINGAKDVQVDPELDARHLADAIKAAGHDVTLHIAPESDHVLKHEARTMQELRNNLEDVQNGYNADGRTIDPDVAQAVESWLAAHVP
ncbi:alpha/beta fold hydrolase [soil metagenome]